MNTFLFAAFLCLGVAAAYPYAHYDDGQYRGEGLLESQDHGQYNHYGYAYPLAYGYADDGQYHGEGLAESQDNHGLYSAYGYGYGYNDGQYKGEGLAESQDYGQYNNHGYAVAAYAPAVYGYASHYAHGAAPLGPDGQVIDTAEVAHAKAAHFAAKAAASHGSHAAIYAPAVYSAPAVYAAPAVYSAGVYSAPIAHGYYAHGAAPLGPDGQVIDTAEVAHAKAAHFAAKAAAGSHSVYAGHYASHYAHGAAPLGPDGRVVDTPEVAHAKAAHFAAKATAGSHAVYGAYAAPSHYAYAGHYAHGAAPIGHDGRVVDTPEVAHAKAAHFAAKAAAGSHHY